GDEDDAGGGASRNPAGHLTRAEDSRLPPAGRGPHPNRSVKPKPGTHGPAGARKEGAWAGRSIRPRQGLLSSAPLSSWSLGPCSSAAANSSRKSCPMSCFLIAPSRG